jgi:hypothetical protein
MKNNNQISLKNGDIIVYTYKGEDEYSIWNGKTITLLGTEKPSAATRIIRGVWKKNEFLPRKF